MVPEGLENVPDTIENRAPATGDVRSSSNIDAKLILKKFILRVMDDEEIEDSCDFYIDHTGNPTKIMISFLKLFLATLPLDSIKETIHIHHVNLYLTLDFENLFFDLMELQAEFMIDHNKFKIYLQNLQNFLKEMFITKEWVTLLARNKDLLDALFSVMSKMCSSHFNRTRETGNIGLLALLHWFMKEEVKARTLDVSDRPFRFFEIEENDDAMQVDEDSMPENALEHDWQYLRDKITSSLETISKSIINDSILSIRLTNLNFITLNYRNFFYILTNDDVLKALAFGIIDCSAKVQLITSKFLLELLESGSPDPKLVAWFFTICAISEHVSSIPVNGIAENLQQTKDEEIVSVSLRLLICLEKQEPGKIHDPLLHYIFLSVCIRSIDACKQCGELLHCVLSRNDADSSQYMLNLVKFCKDLSMKAPVCIFLNTLLLCSTTIFNCQIYVDHLKNSSIEEPERKILVQLMSSVVGLLKGVPNSKIKETGVILINDIDLSQRRTKLSSFVSVLINNLRGLLGNDLVRNQCLAECIDLFKDFPIMFYSQKSLSILGDAFTRVLLEATFNEDVKECVIKVMAYLYSCNECQFQSFARKILECVLLSFQETVVKIFSSHLLQITVDTPENIVLYSHITSQCKNLLMFFEYFDLKPVLEIWNVSVPRRCLTHCILRESEGQVKIPELSVRHAFLFVEAANNFELLKALGNEGNNDPKNLISCIQDILFMMPKMIGWLGNLETFEEMKVLELMFKELILLQKLSEACFQWSGTIIDEYQIIAYVVQPLKKWMIERIPIEGIEAIITLKTEAIELFLQKLLKVIDERALPLRSFKDYIAFCLYKKHPEALKVMKSSKHDIEVVSSIFLRLKKMYFKDVADLYNRSRKRSSNKLASEYMKMLRSTVEYIMAEDYLTGKQIAQRTLDKLTLYIYEEAGEMLNEDMLAKLTIPWVSIVLQLCLPPTFYSYEHIKNWESVSENHPKIASVITELIVRSENRRPNLLNEVGKLIYHPEQYLRLISN